MNIRTLLGGLLAVQVALAAGLFVRDSSSGGNAAAGPLLDFAVADVDRIVIDDNGTSAALTRAGGGWQLDGLAGLPANATKVRTLLDALENLRTTWPVVQSAAGRERLEVSEQRYQRRLQLYQHDTLLGEYYFGTSPGFRQTHARRADDAAVYALTFSNFDLPADSNDWLDKTLLSAASPARIEGPDFEIAKTGAQWQMADATGDATRLDQEEVNELADAFSSLRVLRAEDPAESVTPVTFSVGGAEGDWSYEFSSSAGKYYVRRSDQPHAFTISQSDFERITGKSREELVSNEGADDGAAIEAGDSEDAKV